MATNGTECFDLRIGNCLLKRNESGAQIQLDDEKSFSITIPESSVLKRLVEEDGQVVSRNDLIVDAWGRPDIIGPNSLPVAITNLRKILDLNNIKITNVPRKGYRIDLSEIQWAQPQEPSSQETTLPPPDNNPIYETWWERAKLAVAIGALLFCLYAAFYIVFSWVRVDCQTVGKATLCSIQGDYVDPSIVNGKEGKFFYSNQSGLMQVKGNG
ncbi:winged helix-turn-helix domain-containing protein [Vibrio europaeus]|uniref:Winged helix-turn-helix domain-containing protein n=1 Tax=Vibrio europaeus TaxID=300876 RepID=A0A178JF12_9VIBR|nr:winged helix-turn-helix domain-containing protein [Vibrio europaeus]MDC5707369.1 winged helix-turn-helix domain-containing protein [Vibrio europaeus]MDC5712734.1 winged helix-turn-helix domain-containing protein [Vibrio europaeus]MDC5717377.1 winged helix-turn-helix domain-containing protein [Vibrio europaeus]MDC5726677.1 winged helix-turn-helix domain-containing protein [Vibrio europaeus]MDC5731587.1 winged helix-turn-helix domain-containing protein [Vibrio europaeus]